MEKQRGVTPMVRRRQVGDGMGGGRNGRCWGAPIFGQTLENTAFFHKKMENRGAPKTAAPTTTHAIPHLTPSYIGGEIEREREREKKKKGAGAIFLLACLREAQKAPRGCLPVSG